jgi:hypothetical protein
VRRIRNKKTGIENLPKVWEAFKMSGYNDWLLPIEMLELINTGPDFDLKNDIKLFLDHLSYESESLRKLISNGKKIML